MKYTMHYSPGACSLAAHIVLQELAIPFQLVLTSTTEGATRSPEYLRLNPKGRVPVLITGDAVLTELPAIVLQLALSHPVAQLLPDTPDGLARSIEWFNYLSGTVHAVAIRQVWRPETFTQNTAQHEGIIAKGKENLEAAFAHIEKRLSDSPWAVGTQFSSVDPFLLVIFRWGNRIGFAMKDSYPSWTQHTQRLLQRPAVQRALAREGISVWE
jgi:glutathione S-transferase